MVVQIYNLLLFLLLQRFSEKRPETLMLVFFKGFLGTHRFSWGVASWGQIQFLASLYSDKTAGCALRFMGLFCSSSLVCVTGQGSTDEGADGTIQYGGGRWWSVGSMKGDAYGHQMVDYVLASTSD